MDPLLSLTIKQYLRLVKDHSPSLFSLQKNRNEQHEFMRKFGFIDAVNKDDYKNYYWKDGNDIYAPNPPSHVQYFNTMTLCITILLDILCSQPSTHVSVTNRSTGSQLIHHNCQFNVFLPTS